MSVKMRRQNKNQHHLAPSNLELFIFELCYITGHSRIISKSVAFPSYFSMKNEQSNFFLKVLLQLFPNMFEQIDIIKRFQ